MERNELGNWICGGWQPSRKVADIKRVDSPKPKRKLKVGCWNVRTLYRADKLAQVLREMENYNIDLLGVSEARWAGAGKGKLTSGHTILFPWRLDNQHSGGVAIIINKKHEKYLLQWKPVSDRLIMARQNMPRWLFSPVLLRHETLLKRKKTCSMTSCKVQ